MGDVGSSVRVTRLASGRRVVTDSVPGAASATVLAVVGVGGRDEPAVQSGVSHFLAHLLCKGSATRSSVEVAEEVDADLIVVGNKGMTGARRFLLGSVPNKVSHHAPCSVFIARTT